MQDDLQILLVENDMVAAQLIAPRLSACGQLEQRGSRDSAMQALNERTYDVVVIDLKLHDDSKSVYDGLDVGELARSRNPEAIIVMYSSDIEHKEEQKFPYFEDCKHVADDTISRTWLSNRSAGQLRQYIEVLIQSRAQRRQEEVPVSIDDAPPSHLRTTALADLVGIDKLRAIVRHAIPGYARHTVRAIGGGYSGAGVLMVTSERPLTAKATSAVVKLARSSTRMIEAEVERGNAITTSSAIDEVTPRGSLRYAGWSAVVFKTVAQPRDLRNLVEDTVPAAVLTGLANYLAYNAVHARPIVDVLDRDTFYLRATFCVELIDALRVIRGALESIEAPEPLVRATYSLEQFAERAGQRRWSLGGPHTLVAEQHGDLHCGNILIDSHDQIHIIDLARAGFMPRTTDMAALDVDLLLVSANGGSANHWQWEQLTNWIEVARNQLPFSRGEKPLGDPALEFRHALLANFEVHVNELLEREYLEVLLFQLLRHIRFATIPLPRRVLAVALASDLIATLRLE